MSANADPPLTEIMRSSCPHLGQSQGSTLPECNGSASTWENLLDDQGWLLRQVSMTLEVFSLQPTNYADRIGVERVFRRVQMQALKNKNQGLKSVKILGSLLSFISLNFLVVQFVSYGFFMKMNSLPRSLNAAWTWKKSRWSVLVSSNLTLRSGDILTNDRIERWNYC